MNYLKATELQSGGYHYTVTNDNRTRPHVCCSEHDLTPHATAEEAERCKYEYELSRARIVTTGNTAHKCTECGTWANTAYQIGGYDLVDLCPEHLTPEMLRKHSAFIPGMTSWES